MDISEFNNVVSSSSVVLVDCWATWCPHCMALMPQIDALSQEVGSQAKIVKIDVGESSEVASQFSVMSLPTFLIFKDGDLVDRVSGSTSALELKKRIKNFLD